MARQIEPRLGEPRIAILDRRLADLELRLALLAEAVQSLIGELESQSANERGPSGDGSGRPAVRRAAQLLLECQRRGMRHPAQADQGLAT